MPADALTYALCAEELNNKLSSGRISKITMPKPDTLLLSIRAKGENHLLILSANGTYPRAHLTKETMPSPQVAPSFLMHLRKHMGGGIIEEIAATPFERIINIKIKAFNELLIPEAKSLIIEIMGKHSNIILVNENGKISDSIKHVTSDISSKRQVIPNLFYNQPPSQDEKINVFQTEIFKKKLAEFSTGNLEKYLMTSLYGFATSTIKEAVYNSFKSLDNIPSALTAEEIDTLVMQFQSLYDFSTAKPCAQKLEEGYKDFFVKPYSSVAASSATTNFEFFDSLNEAMDAYYSSLGERNANNSKKNVLLSAIKSVLNRNQKKLVLLSKKREDSINCEDDRIKGDLILSNLHKIRKGDEKIEVEDYYNDNKLCQIEIDPHKSPQANAQLFYKSYNKKKTALSKLDELTLELDEQNEYLESLNYFAELADDDDAYNEVYDELTRLGILKNKTRAKKDKTKKQKSFNSAQYNGYKINIGKSSLSNDLLVKKSSPKSVWLHASGIHGSHVVVENNSNSMPDKDVLVFAAQLAAYHSKARQSENVPVDYTFVANVKKPNGAAPGKVIFTAQKTLFVTPKQE